MSANSSDIARLRLVSQQLNSTKLKTAGDMVSWFGAIQGQEYAQTRWSIGLRLTHLKDMDIEQDLIDGKILRTHMLRPTWHFVAAEDIRWLLKLTAPRVHAANAFMYRKHELDDAFFYKSDSIIAYSLQGGRYLTRIEINEELRKNNIIAEGNRLSYIMMHCELEGIICSGPRRGNQFTYALIEERAGSIKNLNKEEALSELTGRYFKSRGPATVKDFSTWSGLTQAECRHGIILNSSYLEKLYLNDKEYYYPCDLELNLQPSEKIFLMPVFDEYIMGYKDRSDIMMLWNNQKLDPQLAYNNTILFDGQIIGSWKRKIGTRQIELQYSLFNHLSTEQTIMLEDAIQVFSSFYILPVNIRY